MANAKAPGASMMRAIVLVGAKSAQPLPVCLAAWVGCVRACVTVCGWMGGVGVGGVGEENQQTLQNRERRGVAGQGPGGMPRGARSGRDQTQFKHNKSFNYS